MSGRDFMDDKDVFNMLMEIRDNVTTIKVTQEAFTASHGELRSKVDIHEDKIRTLEDQVTEKKGVHQLWLKVLGVAAVIDTIVHLLK